MAPVALSRVAFGNFTGMLVILGAVATLYGPLLISLSRHFHISLAQAGILLSVHFVGALLGRSRRLGGHEPREGKRRRDGNAGLFRAGRSRRRPRLIVAGVLGGCLRHRLWFRRPGLRDQHAARSHRGTRSRPSTERGERRLRARGSSRPSARRSRRASQLSVSLWRRRRCRRHPVHHEPRSRRTRADRRRPPPRTQLPARATPSDPRHLRRGVRAVRRRRVEHVGVDRAPTPPRRALRVAG